MVSEWLKEEAALTEEEKVWLADVVGSHHQLPAARRLHFEPLFEADLIVNLIEGYYTMDKAADYLETMVTTPAGRSLYKSLFNL